MRKELFLPCGHNLLKGDRLDKKKFLKWLKNTVIRAIKTMAQTALASIGTTSVVMSQFHWGFVLSTAGIAGIISLLMSLESLPENEE